MILVLCGTQKQDFSRMVKAVSEIADQEEVIVQGGHNTYNFRNITNVGFLSSEELHRLYNEANIVVTHAGAGSMLAVIQQKKKVIAFPRLKKYGEHVNDHQLELAKKFEDLGYLLMYRDGESFSELYKKALVFHPKLYVSTGSMLKIIDQKIKSYLEVK